ICYQIEELYSAYRCLYYKHAIDRCGCYGKPGHLVKKHTILVGDACNAHPSNISHH
ncbi:uncharacterized protein LY79DRAFT_486441, partial [Colletotrichum navitas]